MKARFIDLIEDAHEGVTTLLGEHPEQKVGKKKIGTKVHLAMW